MLERVKSIILEYVDLDPDTLTADTSLRGDLGLNSFILVNLITAIEEEFDVEIPENEIRSFHDLGDLVHYLEIQSNGTMVQAAF